MRKLATIQVIRNILPIYVDDEKKVLAENIEIAEILDWRCVVRRGEFSVGDKCVYFEVESAIPENESLSFVPLKLCKGKNWHIIKIRRMLGVFSYGLAINVKLFKEAFWFDVFHMEVGEDVSKITGSVRLDDLLEVDIPNMGSAKPRPSYVPKTDETRAQSIFEEIQQDFSGKKIYITMKIDGSSTSFFKRDGEYYASPRNKYFSCSEDVKNVYVRMFHKYPGIKRALDDIDGIVIQGETYGLGVQKNPLGLNEVQFSVFDIFKYKSNEYSGFKDLLAFCRIYDLEFVPIVGYNMDFKFDTMEGLIDLAESIKYDNGTPAEGVVIRSMEPGWFKNIEGEKLSFKVENPIYKVGK